MVIVKTNECSRLCEFVNDSAEKLAELLSMDVSSISIESSGQPCWVRGMLYPPYCGRLGSSYFQIKWYPNSFSTQNLSISWSCLKIAPSQWKWKQCLRCPHTSARLSVSCLTSRPSSAGSSLVKTSPLPKSEANHGNAINLYCWFG